MFRKGIVDLRKKVRTKNSLNDLRLQFNSLIDFYDKNDQKPILICTSARSGSTWLMQMIAAAEGIQYIDQPLDIRNFHTNRYDLEPRWEFIHDSNVAKDTFNDYLHDLIEGKITLQFPHQFWLDGYDLKPNRRVFKILFGLHLIEWFQENFDVHILYLVRHPIPTVLSRHKYNWPFSYVNEIIKNDYYSEIFSENLVSFCENKLSKGSDIEKYTIQWCIENYFPLKHFHSRDWLQITYEELVMNTEDLVKLMIDEFDLKPSDFDRMTQMITKRAKSPMTHDKTEQFLKQVTRKDDRSYLIKKWDDQITDSEANKIFDILDKFGIDTYQRGKFLPTPDNLHFI